MLSFIYEFLQMISGTVATFVHAVSGAFSIVSDGLPWVDGFVSSLGFSDFAVALIVLFCGLALIDKIMGVL